MTAINTRRRVPPEPKLRVKKSEDGESRSIEVELDIDAPVEVVWRALTEAKELESWFPLAARVEAGVGGEIELRWGEEVKARMPVEIWEPARHLRTLWIARRQTAGGEEATPALVDFLLEGRAGTTRLRLVHSGISVAEDWDDIFDGFRRGWAFELRSLQHYLEHHRGSRRGMVRVQHAIGTSAGEAWRRLFGVGGFFPGTAVDALAEGAPYRLTTATGEILSGDVRLVMPPTDFAATVATLEDSLLRVKIGPMADPDRPLVQLWLACWRLTDERIRALETGWQGALDRVFGEA